MAGDQDLSTSHAAPNLCGQFSVVASARSNLCKGKMLWQANKGETGGSVLWKNSQSPRLFMKRDDVGKIVCWKSFLRKRFWSTARTLRGRSRTILHLLDGPALWCFSLGCCHECPAGDDHCLVFCNADTAAHVAPKGCFGGKIENWLSSSFWIHQSLGTLWLFNIHFFCQTSTLHDSAEDETKETWSNPPSFLGCCRWQKTTKPSITRGAWNHTSFALNSSSKGLDAREEAFWFC